MKYKAWNAVTKRYWNGEIFAVSEADAVELNGEELMALRHAYLNVEYAQV